MTTWRDLASLIATMADASASPAWLPGVADLVKSSSPDHYETIAGCLRGLAALDLTDVDLLEPTVGNPVRSDMGAQSRRWSGLRRLTP
jgi:hypothetical protein